MLLNNPMMRATDIKRYSGTYISTDEDIMQHTAQISLLSYLIGLKLIELGENLDIGVLLEKSLLHDIDETLTGDVPRPVKYYNKIVLKNMKKMASDSVSLLCEGLLEFDHSDSKLRISNMIETSKEGPEGLVVGIADILVVVYKSYEEIVLMNNKKFVKVLVDLRTYVHDLRSKLKSHKEELTSDKAYTYLLELCIDAEEVVKYLWDENSVVINHMKYDSKDLVGDR
jgi:5'-deoxynucleotidase